MFRKARELLETQFAWLEVTRIALLNGMVSSMVGLLSLPSLADNLHHLIRSNTGTRSVTVRINFDLMFRDGWLTGWIGKRFVANCDCQDLLYPEFSIISLENH